MSWFQEPFRALKKGFNQVTGFRSFWKTLRRGTQRYRAYLLAGGILLVFAFVLWLVWFFLSTVGDTYRALANIHWSVASGFLLLALGSTGWVAWTIRSLFHQSQTTSSHARKPSLLGGFAAQENHVEAEHGDPLDYFPPVVPPPLSVQELLQPGQRRLAKQLAQADSPDAFAKIAANLQALEDKEGADPEWMLAQAAALLRADKPNAAYALLERVRLEYPHTRYAEDADILELSARFERGEELPPLFQSEPPGQRHSEDQGLVQLSSTLLPTSSSLPEGVPKADPPEEFEATQVQRQLHELPNTPTVTLQEHDTISAEHPTRSTPHPQQLENALPKRENEFQEEGDPTEQFDTYIPTQTPPLESVVLPHTTPSQPPKPNELSEELAQETNAVAQLLSSQVHTNSLKENEPIRPSVRSEFQSLLSSIHQQKQPSHGKFQGLFDDEEPPSTPHAPLPSIPESPPRTTTDSSSHSTHHSNASPPILDPSESTDSQTATKVHEDSTQTPLLIEQSSDSTSPLEKPSTSPSPSPTANQDSFHALVEETLQHQSDAIDKNEPTSPEAMGTKQHEKSIRKNPLEEQETSLFANINKDYQPTHLAPNTPSKYEEQTQTPTLGGIPLELSQELEEWLEKADILREQGERQAANDLLQKIVDRAPDSRYAKDAQMRMLSDDIFFDF